MSQKIAIVCFRQDLRLHDNPALTAARQLTNTIIPVYIFDEENPHSLGGAQQWWLHHSLLALSVSIKARGGRLILRQGDYKKILPELVRETKASAVFWNRCYEPYAIKRDSQLKTALINNSVDVNTFPASLLNEPWTIKNKQGDFFKVFTPYWRAARAQYQELTPLKLVDCFKTPVAVKTDSLKDWQLLPRNPDWSSGFKEQWQPGEQGANKRLNYFLQNVLMQYDQRDFLATEATSKLSAHLHFGEVSPKQVWYAVQQHAVHEKLSEAVVNKFLSEMGWREFSYYLLYHFPDLPSKNFRALFDKFPWESQPVLLKKWQQGQTGYPIVDAGMRELWQTGVMHNRVRMVAASFLIKHLLIDWRKGAAWFWDTLVDADLASNSASWQWVAGSGADAAPYFRIFNPTLQGIKFDVKGEYVRRWLPELSALPDKYIHEPSQAPEEVLKKTGIVLGKTYPKPIVDHKLAREKALAIYKKIK